MHFVTDLNGGSNVMGFWSGFAGSKQLHVHTVSLADWIIRSFRPIDYVFLKIDVEGMEYEILRHLFAQGGIDVIDELAVEFHSRITELEGFADRERFLLWLLEASGVLVHEHP